MNYTPEQIQAVCDKASEVMKGFTDVQNCTFPSTAIISGMNAGKSAQEIASDAYKAIADLPLYQTGFGLIGTGTTMKNVAMFMQGAILKAIQELDPATPEPEKPDEPETPVE